MIVYVYKNAWGEFSYWDRKQYYPSEQCGIFWCILEQPDRQPEKKTVVKERNITTKDLACSLDFALGVNAKNLKLTYEYEVE